MSRQPTTIQDMDEGTYFVGQSYNTLDVLERFNSSMHYKPRSTPGEPESFSNNKKLEATKSKGNIGNQQSPFQNTRCVRYWKL
eukprot:792961-Prorocentrum_lima.AAC.1